MVPVVVVVVVVAAAAAVFFGGGNVFERPLYDLIAMSYYYSLGMYCNF